MHQNKALMALSAWSPV